MAPREVKLPEFPDTLPEDFAEWDGGAAQQQPAPPVKQAPVQNVRPAETRPAAPPPPKAAPPIREVERTAPQPVVRAAKPAPAPAAKAAVDQTWQPTPRPKQPSAPPARPVEYTPAPAQRNVEAKLAEAMWPEAEQKKAARSEAAPRGGHRSVAIGIGAAVVCAGLGAGYMLYSWHSHAQPQPQTMAATTTAANPAVPSAPDAAKPDPRNTLKGSTAANAQNSSADQQQPAQDANAQQSADNTATDNTQPQNPAPNVNMAQFTTQSQIPRNQQPASAPEPSGNIDASHMAGGNSGLAFGGSGGEHVQFAPSKPIDVSSTVLSSTLVKRTMPQYPSIARSMHVSGVVTVAITLTPQGTVAEAHAISGPTLLRPAAVDAVRKWRFRPYLVNNRPVPVQSSVNVDFAMQ